MCLRYGPDLVDTNCATGRAGFDLGAQTVVALPEHTTPRLGIGDTRPHIGEPRAGGREMTLKIQLMREFVEHHVSAIGRILRSLEDRLPREHDDTVAP